MFILDQGNSIASQFIAELRSIHVQLDRMRFRKNLERLGEIMSYEISKTFNYIPYEVETPLGKDPSMLAAEHPVLISVMRAGMPFHQGFLNYYDNADSGFIGAFRKEGNAEMDGVQVDMSYIGAPSIEGRILILIDPMLATGSSLVQAYQSLIDSNGKPAEVHVAAVIAAQAGVDHIVKEIPDVKLWIGALDPELNDQYYIVPGLGDAGDLSFGPKL